MIRPSGALVIAGVSYVGTVLLLAGACDRPDRATRQAPPGGMRPDHVAQGPLVPGMPTARTIATNPYAGDTASLEEGRRLYHWFNCSGCHFEGGGGIGPALMDRAWIYGDEPAQIFDSIASGRANGMPVFGDKLAAEQIWHLVTYVQSLAAPEDDRERGAGDRERQP